MVFSASNSDLSPRTPPLSRVGSKESLNPDLNAVYPASDNSGEDDNMPDVNQSEPANANECGVDDAKCKQFDKIEYSAFGINFLPCNNFKHHFIHSTASLNRAKFLGYIPIIGTIIGLANIIFKTFSLAVDNLDETAKTETKWYILRGFLEITSLGFIFCGIPDLIKTYTKPS